MNKLSRILLSTLFALSIGQYTKTMDIAQKSLALQYIAYQYIDREATLNNITAEEKAADPKFGMKLLKLGLMLNQLKKDFPDFSNDEMQSTLRDRILNLPQQDAQTDFLLSCEPFIDKLVFRPAQDDNQA